MSFVRLDSGEFPPLNSQIISHNGGNQKKSGKNKKTCSTFNQIQELQPTTTTHQQDNNPINNGFDFVKSRVGFQLIEYQDDLEKALETNQVGQLCDFIVAPIEPVGTLFYKEKFDALTDLVLSAEVWHTRVALDIGFPLMSHYDMLTAKHFERLFNHALYLSSPVIIISCPDYDVAQACVASTVNHKLGEIRTESLILVKVPFDKDRYRSTSNSWIVNGDNSFKEELINDGMDKDQTVSTAGGESGDVSLWCSSYSNGMECSQNSPSLPHDSWTQWNSIRNHLRPDLRIGVCLLLNDDLADDEEELSRWTGEPVRMVIIHTDQFVQSPGHNGSLRLPGRCKEFLKRLALANSLKISFVLESRPGQIVAPYLEYLNSLFATIKYQNEDRLRPWDDKIQPPLQPLSSNLDSGTYFVFEMDSMKYIQYRDAMILALRQLLANEKKHERKFILMILGAGRGPLVDSFINAIEAVDTSCRFKIYALDKNPSSVRTLLYKQKNVWTDRTGLYETEVVEADMRTWMPNEKADIIACELLGSLGDNELSPECLDGVWRFSTSKTISIPQSYASYIGPICCYKMHQELYRLKGAESNIYDQIYVCRLTNFYHISKPQLLFQFEHYDLSLAPEERCNERYTQLTFYSKVDTVCHGFAGYFSSVLFGHVTISTLFENKTPNMDSWFPAYIPLKEPVQMPKGTKLVIHFWRKESASSVWYEWVLTSPVKSRIYTMRGLDTAMSKCI